MTLTYDPAVCADRLFSCASDPDKPDHLLIQFDSDKEEPLRVRVKDGAFDLVPDRSSRHKRLIAVLSA